MARIILPSGWSLLIGFGWSLCLVSICLSISRAFFWAKGAKSWCELWVPNSLVLLYFPRLEITYSFGSFPTLKNPVLFCGPKLAAWCPSWHQIFPKSLCGVPAHICHLGAQDTGIFLCGNSGLCGHLSLKQGVACVESEKPSQILSPGFFQRNSTSYPDIFSTERPHQSWGHCTAIGGEGNSGNFRWTSLILCPHILGSRP